MLKAGHIIGNRYEIVELLGSGGMAYVYKAKCHKLNRFVAIKILKSEFSNDPVFLQKFQVEAQAAASLSHPNIVNIYDVGEDGDLFYIVMEYVDGITLKDYIKQEGRLSYQEAVEIAIYIAQGIQAAHAQHIFHRDIKPQNILVGRNGDVKVTDFGIARAASSSTITITEATVGSVHYISPEQARGGYSDERSDFYSLGVTLYEMVSGKVPFDGDNNVAVALAHIQKEPVPLSDLCPDIPRSLEKIIIKMMQKRSERRYQTTQEILLDLKRVFANPDGNYVSILPSYSDSPTIMLSEKEREKIKAGVRATEELQKKENKTPQRVDTYQEKDDVLDQEDYEYEDDDEQEKVNPKLEKIVFSLGIVAAVLVAIFLIFLIGKGLNLFTFGETDSSKTTSTTVVEIEDTEDSEDTEEIEEVAMISVVGKRFVDAQRELEELGLSFAQPRYVSSDEYEEGYIIEQDIAANEMVKKGTQIHVTISQGSDKVSVPSFIGETKDSASILAKNSNLSISFQSKYDDEVEAGEIFKQSIAAGEKVKPNTTIVLTISLGKEQVKITVQDFKDMSKSDAQDLARQFGLVLKPIEQYSDYPEGLIYEQDIKSGTQVEQGTVVTVYISKGKEPVQIFRGSITLTQAYNPFVEGEEGNESGPVKLVMDQDGEEQIIFSGILSYSDFPKTIEFKSHSDERAYIYMIVNGEQVQGAEWYVDME